MDHTETLRRHEHVCDLQDYANGVLLWLRTAEGDGGTKRIALDVVHHEEIQAAGFIVPCVMDRH